MNERKISVALKIPILTFNLSLSFMTTHMMDVTQFWQTKPSKFSGLILFFYFQSIFQIKMSQNKRIPIFCVCLCLLLTCQNKRRSLDRNKQR